MQARGFLNYRLNIAGRKLSTVYANQANFNGNLRKIVGANQKSGGLGPPRPPP